MNPAPELAAWLRPIGLIAFEVAVLVGVAGLAQRLVSSPRGRHALWQACVLGVLVLLAAELSGLGRQGAGWLAARTLRQAMPSPSEAMRDAAGNSDSKAPDSEFGPATLEVTTLTTPLAQPWQLSEDFRRRVASRVAAHRASAHDELAEPLSSSPPVSAVLSPPPLVSTALSNGLEIALAWSVGALLLVLRVLLARSLTAFFRFRCGPLTDRQLSATAESLARHLGLRQPLRLKEAGRLRGPIAFGWLRPTVVLPAGFATQFTSAQQEAMLAHEIAHLAARDPLWHFLADLAAALLWWHPLVWWARRQLQAASETAADAASVLVANGPQVLAECLVELGNRLTQRETLGWLGVSGFRSQLGQRVEHLLSLNRGAWTPPERWRSALLKALGASAVVAITLFGTAWALPQTLTEGDDMKTIQQSWKQSLAALALLASANLERAPAEPPSQHFPPRPPSASSLAGTEPRESSEIEIEAEDSELNPQTGELTARGSVRVRAGALQLNAEEIQGNQQTGIFRPKGKTRVRFLARTSGPESLAPKEFTRFFQNDTGGELAAGGRVFPVQAEKGAIDEGTDILRLSKVSLKAGETELRADTLTLDQKKRELTATGNVELEVRPSRLRAERISIQSGVASASAGAEKVDPAVQPGTPSPVVAPAAQNPAQLDPKLAERYGIRPTPPPAGSPSGVSGGGRMGGVFGGGGGVLARVPGSALEGKLEQIVFDEISFDGLPLPEVIKFLADQTLRRDPDKHGINFLLNPNVVATAPAAPLVDPTTGSLIPAPSPEPMDMNNVMIRISPPMRNMRLKDVLDAVVKVADRPIQYSVEDYAVVFSQNPETRSPGTDVGLPPNFVRPLAVRTFKVDTNNFAAGLEYAFDIKLASISTPADRNRSKQMQAALRQLLSQLGIPMDVAGKAVFYNELTGVIMVRATPDDLEIVNAAIETLGGAPHDSSGAVPAAQMSEVMRQRYGLPSARR